MAVVRVEWQQTDRLIIYEYIISLTRLAGTLAQAFCFGVEPIQGIAIAAAPHEGSALLGRIVVPPFVDQVGARARLRWSAAFFCKWKASGDWVKKMGALSNIGKLLGITMKRNKQPIDFPLNYRCWQWAN